MALVFKGDCTWRLVDVDDRGASNDIPVLIEKWEGRADQTATFKAAYTIGMSHGGGYITDRNFSEPAGPKHACDLTVTLAPDFEAYLARGQTSIKTATKTASVDGTSIIPSSLIPEGVTAPDPVLCSREVSFYAPETNYSYFSETEPTGPRFDAIAIDTAPRIIRSVIKASLSSGEIPFSGGNAPAALVTALTMAPWDKVTSFDADPIPGTPWWKCNDVVSRELEGDS